MRALLLLVVACDAGAPPITAPATPAGARAEWWSSDEVAIVVESRWRMKGRLEDGDCTATGARWPAAEDLVGESARDWLDARGEIPYHEWRGKWLHRDARYTIRRTELERFGAQVSEAEIADGGPLIQVHVTRDGGFATIQTRDYIATHCIDVVRDASAARLVPRFVMVLYFSDAAAEAARE